MYNCPVCGRSYTWKRYIQGRHTDAPVNTERTIRCSNILEDGSRCGTTFDVVRRVETVRKHKLAQGTFDKVPIQRHWYSFFMPKQKYVPAAPKLESAGEVATEYFDIHVRDA